MHSVGFDLSSQMSSILFASVLVLGIIYYRIFRVSPGGFIVPPAIIVTALEGVASLLTVIGLVLATWGTIALVNKVSVLYGKTLFGMTLITSVVYGVTAFQLLHAALPELFPGDRLGYLIPGLITYAFMRQTTKATLVATTAVTAAGSALALIMVAV